VRSFDRVRFDSMRLTRRPESGIPAIDELLIQLESKDMPGRQEILARFGITERMFDVLFVSYRFSLLHSRGDVGGWNHEIDAFAREIGALSEGEIEAARTSLHAAILNRIKLRLTVSQRFATKRES